MKQRTIAALLAFLVAVWPAAPLMAADGGTIIRLGISSSTTGAGANIGASTRNGAEMAAQEINAANGLSIAGKTYTLELVNVDNKSNRSIGTTNALALITQHQVMAIVGPQNSDRAIAVGGIANAYKTPIVIPWASTHEITRGRQFVFRLSVIIDDQATATTKFAARKWKATKAAVLYDGISPYPNLMAKTFKQAFEKANGPGSVVAFEAFATHDTDFSKQLQVIANSGADFLYTPQFYNEVPLIVDQIRKMGWKKPVTGSNSWSAGNMMGICGDACKGLYFTGNFAANGTVGKAKAFTENYQKKYNMPPDEVAALTYDAVYLLAEALKNTKLTGNIMEDRIKLRDQIAAIKQFEGVTGIVGYFGTGDPPKCAALIKFDDSGGLTAEEKICPEH